MSNSNTSPQSQQPTTLAGAALAFINSIFAMGVLLEWWNLSAPQIAGIQLVFGNLFLFIGVIMVQAHTDTKQESAGKAADKVAEATGKDVTP